MTKKKEKSDDSEDDVSELQISEYLRRRPKIGKKKKKA